MKKSFAKKPGAAALGLLVLSACGRDQRPHQTDEPSLASSGGRASGGQEASGGQGASAASGGSENDLGLGGVLGSGGAVSGGAAGTGGSGGEAMGGLGGSDPGAAGPLGDPSLLLGEWDVKPFDFALPEGCSWHRGRHLHLSLIETDEGYETSMSWDFFPDAYRSNVQLSDFSFSTDDGRSTNWSVRLQLGVNEYGWAGAGVLSVKLSCGAETALVEAPVTIEADTTPPRLRVRGGNHPPAAFFSFTVAVPSFSERLLQVPDAPWPYLEEDNDPSALFDVIDAGTGASVAHEFAQQTISWPWGVRFPESEVVPGRKLRFQPRVPLTDRAGNALQVDEEFELLPSAVLGLTNDLSVEPSGLHRGARWIAPDSSEPWCESRGCVVLEDQTWPCDPQGLGPSETSPFFSFLLPGDPTRQAEVRYRYYTREDEAPFFFQAGLYVAEGGAGYGVSDGGSALEVLPAPLEGYTHASPWRTTASSFLGAAEQKGYVIFLPCHSTPTPRDILLVIDHINAVE